MGLLVETHDGRPTKIEGNPDHPYSLGACSVHAQASLLSMYDPDRAQKVFKEGNESGWEEFDRFVEAEFTSKLGQGEGLRFLSGRILSPSYRALKNTRSERLSEGQMGGIRSVCPGKPASGHGDGFRPAADAALRV